MSVTPPPGPARCGTASPQTDVARLFDEHAPALLRYLTMRVGADAADDLTADVFEAILKGSARFDGRRGSERAWLFGVATNLLRHHVRSRGREHLALVRMSPSSATAGPAEAVISRVDAERSVAHLRRALAELRPDDRDLLLLVAWGQLAPTEAATSLGIPPGTARSRLHRVRATLRDALPALIDDTEGL